MTATARRLGTTKRLAANVTTGGALTLAGALGLAALTAPAHADTVQARTQRPAQAATLQHTAAKAKDSGGKDAAAAGRSAGTARAVIDLARTQIGTREDASGNTKFNDWYAGSELGKANVQRAGGSNPAIYKGKSWCDMFVTWLGQSTGAKGMGADAYTVDHAKWFAKAGRFGHTPKPGAVAFFAWGGGGIEGIDHVGIVVKDNHDGTVDTIEGNTGNAVKNKVRDTSLIAGYGYPEYR
ncbi:CHAP domain-containing protein [Actinomadura rupiterrae]|uniref:CHAP domain-containing protein n=1 Tax=Actinomadura rupiterrae TaxID=559627 RepID=UPI0020A39FE9|nr:CHAP domain-containing protein [Actinomadura rupiterrae]MCP2342331.1 cell wall-associated NlpC family hydrolase [Actinomadura rupiterrae]